MSERLSAEQKDQILKGVHKRAEEYAATGAEVERYSIDLKAWLEKQPGVTRVTVRGANTLTVEFNDNTQIGVLLDRQMQYGGGKRHNGKKHDTRAFSDEKIVFHQPEFEWPPKILPLRPDTPDSRNALLFDPLYDDWPPDETTDDIEKHLISAGYKVEKLLSDKADLGNLAMIGHGNYGVIFMRSHGGLMVINNNDQLHILVRPYFNTWPASSGYQGVSVFSVGTNWGPKYAYAFNAEFVKQYLAYAKFPDTLMHLLVCHGGDPLAKDDMIDTFLSFGVGCYTGWTRNASSQYGDPAAVEFFRYLCMPSIFVAHTVKGAIGDLQNLGDTPDPVTGAELVLYGKESMALRWIRLIKLEIPPEIIEQIDELPDEAIDLVLVPPKEFTTTERLEYLPNGGMISPVDRLGRRFFMPFTGQIQVRESEAMMREAVEMAKA